MSRALQGSRRRRRRRRGRRWRRRRGRGRWRRHRHAAVTAVEGARSDVAANVTLAVATPARRTACLRKQREGGEGCASGGGAARYSEHARSRWEHGDAHPTSIVSRLRPRTARSRHRRSCTMVCCTRRHTRRRGSICAGSQEHRVRCSRRRRSRMTRCHTPRRTRCRRGSGAGSREHNPPSTQGLECRWPRRSHRRRSGKPR